MFRELRVLKLLDDETGKKLCIASDNNCCDRMQ